MRLRPVVVVLAILSCVPVRPNTPDAIFSRAETCPIDRVSMSELPRRSVRELILTDTPPPKAIENDPERRELWIKEHQRRWRNWDDVHVYAVDGCNIRSEIACADYAVGGLVCRTVSRHDLAFEAQLKQIDDDVAKMQRDACALPMSSSFSFCNEK